MVSVFLVSVLAGMVLGAPVGVSGALAADAALVHNGRLMRHIIIASISGEGILAVLASLCAARMQLHLESSKGLFFVLTGLVVMLIGVISLVNALRFRRGLERDSLRSGRVAWLLEHGAPPLAAFVSNLLHPGNILAFLFTVATLSGRLADFSDYYYLFGPGVCIGSGMIFALVALMFWKVRHKADRFVHHIRYALGVAMCVFGVYLILGSGVK